MPQVQLFPRLKKTSALGITGGPWNAVSRGKTQFEARHLETRTSQGQQTRSVCARAARTFRAMQLLSLTAVVCTRLERMGVLE